MRKLLTLLRLIAVLLLTVPATAQYGPVVKDSLASKILQEKRRLEIVLPPGGLQMGVKYDVLYVLDGEWNSTLVQQIAGFWVNERLIPPQIIVNVLNGEPNMRDRDFTPTHVADNANSGKADDFIRFLKEELQPYIDEHCPVSGYNTLFGHSFGGLFGMYALLKEPGLFNAYILGDPSFWWDNQYIYPLTTARLKAGYKTPVTLFILGKEGNGARQMDAAGMDSVLRALPAGAVNWKSLTSREETHNSTKLRTLVEGFRFVYKGYIGSPLQVNPTSGGIVLAGQPITLYCYNDYLDPVHYHTGKAIWLPLQGVNTIAVDQPADLTITYASNRPEQLQFIKEHFETGAVLKAVGKPRGNWLPDERVNLSQLPADAAGWKRLDAYLEIRQTGYYNLQVMGAGAIRWYMNKKLAFKADSAAANGRYQSMIVPLEMGYYQVHIEVKAEDPAKEIVLLYNTPSSGGNGIGLLGDLLYLQANKKEK